MNLRQEITDDLSRRLSALIEDGEKLLESVQVETRWSKPYLIGSHQVRESKPYEVESIDRMALSEWTARCRIELEDIFGSNPTFATVLSQMAVLERHVFSAIKIRIGHFLGVLRAARATIEIHSESLQSKLASLVSDDLLRQAECLVEDGSVMNRYLPAAVLAGAVLENVLRRVCERQFPPIETEHPDGRFRKMNDLINDLKKQGVFDEAKAKYLRAWADTRNKAAHGRVEELDQSDVTQMLSGVREFVRDFTSG